MLDTISKEAEKRMQKAIEVLKGEFSKIRTGRAHPSLLDHLRVPYYGNDVPLTQVASVTVADARTLAVSPWEKTLVGAIEKAIRTSDLGVNPATAGSIIRVPLPALTEDRRKEMVKVIRHEAETGRVSVRNVRRDALSDAKNLLKDKKITEDEERRFSEKIQGLTDRSVKQIEELIAAKEKELLEV